MGSRLKAQVAALSAMAFCAAASLAQQDGEPEVDWLVEQYWHEGLRDGLLTLNAGDLERYLPTGNVRGSYQVGPLVVVNRGGIYYGKTITQHTPVDEPSGVIVLLDGKIVAGAKGYQFSTRVVDGMIIIKHWNGSAGCAISNWNLGYDLETVWFASSRYLSFPEEEPCSPS